MPIHKEGYPFIAIAAVRRVLLGSWWSPLGWIGAHPHPLGLLLLPRSRTRVTPLRDGLVVSPADGRVSLIDDGRAAGGAGPAAGADDPRLGVHERLRLPREPRAGRAAAIAQIVYTPGLFLNAELDKASEDNERNALVIEADGTASASSRSPASSRAASSASRAQGDCSRAGERFGLIRFGSRLDVYLPLAAHLLVGLGQTAIAGETPLADLRAHEPARQFRDAESAAGRPVPNRPMPLPGRLPRAP